MPALAATRFKATVTWLGIVGDRDAALPANPVPALTLGFAGPEGESHGGLTRPSCSRVLGLYPRNTPIRNTRQLSILSEEELASIAAAMGLPALDPALLGASMVVRGLPDFSRVPPSSRLLADSGACLTVDMENRPCTLPARPIEQRHPGFGARFKPAAAGRRGVTAWVEAEGPVALGDSLRLFIPDQPPWSQAAMAVAD
ncbi:MAG: MOSC domain-containing protein [Rhodobacter sp.]|uniref:MOSC domain-containing protein n=1 Tax=Pararhodobacter sp. TaxID=2127056 RepID=UPI002B53B540|nr:MOSC domain-containing protein [Pararhodobacter sp.]MCC0071930.1 MOSC domain-containing protein [Rhodobacter sp.]HPD91053.1 sulfurase [Pararhodobacter sp.]